MRLKMLIVVLAGVVCGLAMPRDGSSLGHRKHSERIRRVNDRRAEEYAGQAVAGLVAVAFAAGFVASRPNFRHTRKVEGSRPRNSLVNPLVVSR